MCLTRVERERVFGLVCSVCKLGMKIEGGGLCGRGRGNGTVEGEGMGMGEGMGRGEGMGMGVVWWRGWVWVMGMVEGMGTGGGMDGYWLCRRADRDLGDRWNGEGEAGCGGGVRRWGGGGGVKP